jgi:hypothetical protein
MPSHLGLRPLDQRTVAKLLRWFHLAGIIVWALLAIPTVIWWKNSILWVSLMSVYAIVLAHFAAYMAGRTEQHEIEDEQ